MRRLQHSLYTNALLKLFSIMSDFWGDILQFSVKSNTFHFYDSWWGWANRKWVINTSTHLLVGRPVKTQYNPESPGISPVLKGTLLAVALRTISLIVNPAPYLDRCGFCGRNNCTRGNWVVYISGQLLFHPHLFHFIHCSASIYPPDCWVRSKCVGFVG